MSMRNVLVVFAIVTVLGWGVDEWAVGHSENKADTLTTQVVTLIDAGDLQKASDTSLELVKYMRVNRFVQDQGYLESMFIALTAHKAAGHDARVEKLMKHTAKVALKVYPGAGEEKLALQKAYLAFTEEYQDEG